MKQFLIIPMGGIGERFIKSGYKTYKPFLKIDKKKTIIDGIINNFDFLKTELILIGNKKKIQKYCPKAIFDKSHCIEINTHKKGPLFSIYLAIDEIKKIIKKNSFYICYSDINWNWNFKKVLSLVKDKNAVIFTHTNFHPHLEIDPKSDFCVKNKLNNITNISQKKTNFSDYKKELLATGCYFFKNINLIENLIKNFDFFSKINKKKEFYLVSIIKTLLKKNIKINHIPVKNFVHLGTPNQYEDYLAWQEIIKNKFNTSLNLNYPNIMLMGGKGTRVKKLSSKKPFLKLKHFKIYEYIFKKFGSVNNTIITNSNYLKNFPKGKYKIHLTKKTKSMLSTVTEAKELLYSYKKYFLTSCDCYGEFNINKFKKMIHLNKPDLIVFGYKFSNLQKKLHNAHTELIINNSKLLNINVKNNSKRSRIGHAGFFWIGNSNIFKYLDKFQSSVGKKISKNRELIIDDYFSFLLKNNLANIRHYMLDNYVHVGSIKEFQEYKYWEDYFL